MAVDCCQRLKPRLEQDYFSITIQSILTNATITSFSGFALVQFGLEAIGPSTQFNVGIWYWHPTSTSSLIQCVFLSLWGYRPNMKIVDIGNMNNAYHMWTQRMGYANHNVVKEVCTSLTTSLIDGPCTIGLKVTWLHKWLLNFKSDSQKEHEREREREFLLSNQN